MLKIGVLGHTLEQSRQMLREIVDSEREQNKNIIIRKSYDKAWLLDGTTYYALSNSDNVRGIRLDQLIILDRDIYDIDYYHYVLLPCLSSSCVPEEYLIQVFE